MKPPESQPNAPWYVGHVHNGVVVLGSQVTLQEGQAVRVELLANNSTAPFEDDRAERVRMLQQLFAEWTEEDGKLTAEEADRLSAALAQNRGINFRPTKVD
jgi:hypothetical protein